MPNWVLVGALDSAAFQTRHSKVEHPSNVQERAVTCQVGFIQGGRAGWGGGAARKFRNTAGLGGGHILLEARSGRTVQCAGEVQVQEL